MEGLSQKLGAQLSGLRQSEISKLKESFKEIQTEIEQTVARMGVNQIDEAVRKLFGEVHLLKLN